MKRIYADNAAITPTDARVLKEMRKYEGGEFGNPSSIHAEGVKAKKVLDMARKGCAGFLSAHADEIVFTGSGTEANNLAIFGVVNKLIQNGMKMEDVHIVTSVIEHPSVLECVHELQRRGAKVDFVPVLPNGIVDLKVLKEKITADTALVSVMYVNNEIGTVQPITEIAKIIRYVKKNKNKSENKNTTVSNFPLFHTDASQAALYLEMNVEKLGMDMLTLDAHKVYGPKGIGALYIKRGIEISPIIFGGGQESNRRSATPNVSAAVGFAKALQIAAEEKEAETARLTELRDYFLNKIVEKIPNVIINGDRTARIANNVNITIPNVDSEFLVLQLDAAGIACSTKSSCLHDEDESYVIRALGNNDAKNALRFTFGRTTTLKEVDYILKTLISKISPSRAPKQPPSSGKRLNL